jgi:hypothetical protein
VYEVLPPFPVFTVNVSVTEVDRFMTTFGSYQRATWRNVGYFLLSPSHLKGETAEGRVTWVLPGLMFLSLSLAAYNYRCAASTLETFRYPASYRDWGASTWYGLSGIC